MSKISEIISKQIISLYDAKIVGTVENIFLDEKLKNLKGFIVFEDENQDKKILFIEDLLSSNEDNLVIRNSSKLKEFTLFSTQNNPINKEVFSITGDYLGKIFEIELKNNKIVNFLSNKNNQIIKIFPEKIVSENEIIIYNLSDKKINKSHFAPKTKANYIQDIKVEIMENLPQKNSFFPPRLI